jgi:hypothetical protein
MPDDRRPPRPHGAPASPAALDAELRESLELMATLVASVSDRVDGQANALDRMAKVLAETRTAAFTTRKHTDPAGYADQVARQVEERLGRALGTLIQTANLLGEKTAHASRVLQEAERTASDAKRAAASEKSQAAAWRDRRRRLALWAAPALLALLLLTALLAPRLMAASETLCTLAGSSWFENLYNRTCMFDALW